MKHTSLLAVDGNSILNRAFFGIRALTNSKGLPTNAVYGMITMLERQLEDLSPDIRVIAFDMHAPTFRHQMYDGYKATRHPMPEELAVQMPYAHRAAEALGFRVIECEGYEADDILGTLAARGEADGDTQVYIMTGDRDSLQLIGDSTTVLLATNTEYVRYDRAAFQAKYGVDPSQYVDVKALMGDSSDNIPGVRGIGEKTAFALIAKYGSLDGVYAHLDDGTMKPGVLKNLTEGKASAELSRRLAAIFREVPCVPQISELPRGGIDRKAASELFTELEFSALIRKFGLDCEETPPAAVEIPEKNSDADFSACVSTPDAALSFDGEFLTAYNGSFLSAVRADRSRFSTVAQNAGTLSVNDAKSLCRASDAAGVPLRGIGFDVMLAAYVLDAQGGTELDKMVPAYLGEIRNAAVPDAVYIYRLSKALKQKLSERGCEKLFRTIEMPLSDVLTDMEEEGFLLDAAGLEAYGSKLNETVSELAARIWFLAGEEFNINSPRQLGEILFEKMKMPGGKKTKTGYSTNAEVLEKLAPRHEIVADVLEYRKLTKLIGTYVTGLLKVAEPDGRVRTTFKQTGTATGRLSSAEPNLQNIPIKTDEGRELRKYFISRPGFLLIDADYSQIELRLLAAISGDEKFIQAFRSGLDIHASTASEVFHIPLEEVTPTLRKQAKAVNFGIVYGIGDFSLSQDLNISIKEAKEYIERYLSTYPAVSAYLKNIIEQARRDGYVDTLYGRRRFIPELSAKNMVQQKFGERVAMNSPIQGSAADIIKIAMINVSRRLRAEGLNARMILQVHDELIVEAAADCAGRAAEILREEMENAVTLPVPLSVDLSIGERWFEM